MSHNVSGVWLYTTPLYTTPHHTTLHHTTPHPSTHHTTPHLSTPHHTTPLYTTPLYTTPLYTTPHHTTSLHHTTIHHTTLHDTTPHHSTPHHFTPKVFHVRILNVIIWIIIKTLFYWIALRHSYKITKWCHYFQQNGSPLSFHTNTRASTEALVPAMNCKAHAFPHLTRLDLSLCEFIKDVIYAPPIRTALHQLQQGITQAVTRVKRNSLWWIWQ
jgi:hypothetical protein